MTYICTCCGQTHEGLPDLVFDRPAYARDVPEQERQQRVRLNADICVVDDEHYFIRGIIEIPIRSRNEKFGIGAWVSQKRENFQTYLDQFDASDIGPFFGWLSNEFVFRGKPTLNLKTIVHFRGKGLRPLIQLEPTGHPLALVQRQGMTIDEAWVFVHEARGDAAT
jgi:hypothetical protein